MKAISILIAAFFAGACASRAAVYTIGGPIINPANGHSYFLLSSANWTDSEAYAQTLGGYLATINDAAENSWVFATFAHYGSTEHSLWIGLNDVASEGHFVWASGEPVTYINWNSGEPNNNLGLENYAYILNVGTSIDGTWNDYQNLVSIPGQPAAYGVVEVVPEPSAFGLLVLGILGWGRLKSRPDTR